MEPKKKGVRMALATAAARNAPAATGGLRLTHRYPPLQCWGKEADYAIRMKLMQMSSEEISGSLRDEMKTAVKEGLPDYSVMALKYIREHMEDDDDDYRRNEITKVKYALAQMKKSKMRPDSVFVHRYTLEVDKWERARKDARFEEELTADGRFLCSPVRSDRHLLSIKLDLQYEKKDHPWASFLGWWMMLHYRAKHHHDQITKRLFTPEQTLDVPDRSYSVRFVYDHHGEGPPYVRLKRVGFEETTFEIYADPEEELQRLKFRVEELERGR